MLKNLLFVIFLILTFLNSAYALEETEQFDITPQDLEATRYFRSPMDSMLNDDEMGAKTYHSFDTYSYNAGRDMSVKEIDPYNMPLFKQMRLHINNKWNTLTADKTEEELEQRREARKNFVSKFKFKKKDNNAVSVDPSVIENAPEGSIIGTIKDEITSSMSDEETDVLSLESGISEQVVSKQLQLDCDNVDFDEESGDMIATGRPVLYLPEQNTTVVADKMVYNDDSNILKAMGNVIVTRDGVPSNSDYFEVDMNEESMFMDDVTSKTQTMNVNAKKVINKDSILYMEDGTFYSDVSEIHRMSSRMIGPNFMGMELDDRQRSYFLSDPRGNKLHITAEKIYVDARKNHDVFTFKRLEVRRRGKYWFTWPSLTAYTNKQRDYFEANYPEFGSKRKVGMFIGPGFVFGGPNGSIMKVIPFLNYQHSEFGFGGALKYRNTYNSTEMGYASTSSTFFLRGTQRLDDNLFLHYGANSFMDEWFLGARMPKYMAEVFYDKTHTNANFLAKDRTLTFRHRLGLGLMQDNDRNFYGEKFAPTGISTPRLRYMAEIRQALYSYENPEKKFYFDVALALQGSAAVYGTGDTQFVGRIGPSTHIQYKNWMQDLAYYQTGYDDKSPMPRYDAYRYGASSVYIAEILRINKYLSVGWSGYVNLSDDSPNGKLFQENRFGVAVGPDDLKIRFGYDFVRQTTYFGFDLAFDTKGTTVDYGRVEIKNPERLGQRKKNEERKLAFKPSKPVAPESSEVKASLFNRKEKSEQPAVILQYAQVVDIEDPDKETIQ